MTGPLEINGKIVEPTKPLIVERVELYLRCPTCGSTLRAHAYVSSRDGAAPGPYVTARCDRTEYCACGDRRPEDTLTVLVSLDPDNAPVARIVPAATIEEK